MKLPLLASLFLISTITQATSITCQEISTQKAIEHQSLHLFKHFECHYQGTSLQQAYVDFYNDPIYGYKAMPLYPAQLIQKNYNSHILDSDGYETEFNITWKGANQFNIFEKIRYEDDLYPSQIETTFHRNANKITINRRFYEPTIMNKSPALPQ